MRVLVACIHRNCDPEKKLLDRNKCNHVHLTKDGASVNCQPVQSYPRLLESRLPSTVWLFGIELWCLDLCVVQAFHCYPQGSPGLFLLRSKTARYKISNSRTCTRYASHTCCRHVHGRWGNARIEPIAHTCGVYT